MHILLLNALFPARKVEVLVRFKPCAYSFAEVAVSLVIKVQVFARFRSHACSFADMAVSLMRKVEVS